MPGSVGAVNDQGAPESPDDDPYRSLFRDDAPAQPAPVERDVLVAEEPSTPAEPAPADSQSAPADASQPVVEAAARPDLVDTGRLFRSHRVEGHVDAVPAVTPSHAHRLRTLASVASDAEPAPAAVLLPDAEPVDQPVPPPTTRRTMPSLRLGGSMTALGVTVVVGGTTLLFGLADALLFGPGLGWLTGIALLLSSVLAAMRVRIDTAPSAIFAPPLAFFAAAVTVGQLGQSVASGALSRAVVVFFLLAENWLWIIGATVAALLIVVVRTRQSR